MTEPWLFWALGLSIVLFVGILAAMKAGWFD
jgi:hypothetical protein